MSLVVPLVWAPLPSGTRAGCPPGAAVLGIQAFKGVEVGLGFGVAERPGLQVHDPILPGEKGAYPQRASNNAGGIEGGMTNGQPVVVRGAMKPISTLLRGLPSVDLRTGEAAQQRLRAFGCGALAGRVGGDGTSGRFRDCMCAS